MTKHIVLNKFDGGHAEDIRTFATDECEKSLNFDVFSNPHKLIPFPDSIAETVDTNTMDDIEISDIDVSLIGSTYTLSAIGYTSNVSVIPSFYTKSALTNGGTLNWAIQATSAGNAFVKGSGVVYKDKLYGLAFNGTNQYTLYRYNSAGSVTAVGTISSTSTSYARPFVHPEDNIMYITIGTTITSWDNTTITTTTTILPSGFEAISLTDYGSYLAIGMRPLRNNGNAVVYLWGRDATINTLQGTLDFGEGNLVAIENLNNNLIAILQTQNAFSTAFQNKMIIRGYAGGAVETLKSFILSSTQTINFNKIKNGNKLYFACNNDDAVYAFGKNKDGKYILTKDRYMNNGTTIGSSIGGLAMIGDIMWKGFNTASAYVLMRQMINSLGESYAYTSTSTYKTTINPKMEADDRYIMKQLKGVRVSYTGKSSGTLKIKGSADSSTLYEFIALTGLTAIEDTTYSDTIATASGSLGVGDPLPQGREFQFQVETTGGVEIKQIEYFYDLIPTY